MSKSLPTPLSSRRPVLENSTSLSSRLAALENWTEEPTMVAFDALQTTNDEIDANVPTHAEKPALALENTVGQGAAEQVLPWANASEEKLSVFMFKPSEALHLKLKFLGETTYGMTMQKIVVDAVEQRVAALLKARGLAE